MFRLYIDVARIISENLVWIREREMKKYFGKFVPKKFWIDANEDGDGDGDVDYQDFIFAAKSALNSITPSKQTLDINGDGKVDINDALDAARITGAAIAATGITVAVSSYAGAVLVTGQATTIATTITASIGAGIGGGLTALLGSTTTVAWATWQTSSGVWIIAAKGVKAISPTLVASVSGASAFAASSAQSAVSAIAGFPLIEKIAMSSLVGSGDILIIAGVPIAREVAIASALVALVVFAGYTYYILTRKRINKEEVLEHLEGLSPAL